MFKQGIVLALAALVLGAGPNDRVVTPERDAGPGASKASTLTVTIEGATSLVPQGTYCTWNAGVSGGTPPYQFQWIGNQGVGTMSSYTELTPDSQGAIVWIELTVTDANGQSGYASEMPITAHTNTPC